MRVSLLLEREPFPEILEATLSRYWTATTGRPTRVVWAPQAEVTGQVWRGNSRLNFFAVDETPRDAFSIIVREFGRSRRCWLRPAQAFYVRLAVARPLRPVFCDVAFVVDPPLQDARGHLLVAGNHRLRLLHPAARRSVVILKSGADPRHLAAEVEARRGIARTLAPALGDTATDGSWAEEEYVEGTPINRLPASEERAWRQRFTERLKRTLVEPSAVAVPAHRAADALLEQVAALAIADSAHRDAVAAAAGALAAVARSAGTSLVTSVSASHGDLQPANLLVSGSQSWVIDWEGFGRRLSVYDPLTLLLNTRQDARWEESLPPLLAGARGDVDVALAGWPAGGWTPGVRRPLLALFAMEELLFRLSVAADYPPEKTAAIVASASRQAARGASALTE